VDETHDVAKREQMAVVFRFIDKNGVLQERFFDLIHVKNTRALTLKEELAPFYPIILLTSKTFVVKDMMVAAI